MARMIVIFTGSDVQGHSVEPADHLVPLKPQRITSALQRGNGGFASAPPKAVTSASWTPSG